MKNLCFILLFFPLFSLGQQILNLCDDISNQSYIIETPSDPSNTFSWNVYEQGTTNEVPEAVLTGANTLNVLIDWSSVSTGVYTLQFTETNSVPCEATQEITVTIEDGSFTALVDEVIDVCEGTLESQAPTITDGLGNPLLNVTYDWNPASSDNGELASLDLSQMTPPYTGGSIATDLALQGTVTITNQDGCTYSLTEDFYNVIPNPTPSVIIAQ